MKQSQLNFIGLTTIAIKTVTQAYPNASFRGAIGKLNGDSTTNPHDITDWDFNFGDGKVPACINIQTEGEWGNFGSPIYSQSPTGGEVIPWPIAMDISEATDLLRAAGYTQAFNGLTLHWPIHDPSYGQPLYIFSFDETSPIAVGVYRKDVFPF